MYISLLHRALPFLQARLFCVVHTWAGHGWNH